MFFQPFKQVGVLIFVLFRELFIAEAQLKLFFEFLYLRVQEALISKPNKLTEHASFEGISVPDASACTVQSIFRIFKGFFNFFSETVLSQSLEAVFGFVRDKGKVAVIFPSLSVGFFVYRNFELTASAEPADIEILFCLLLS